MQVTVLFFGVLKEMLASESHQLDLPPGATVEAVLRHYHDLLPQPAQALGFARDRGESRLCAAQPAAAGGG